MRKQSGFTLIELMIVISIVAILTAVTIPNLISWRNNAQLSAGARQIYSDLQMARKEAIKRNSLVTIDFDTNSYEIFRNGASIAQKNVPPGIRIDSAVFNTLGDIASFNSFGFGRTFLNEDNNGDVTISRGGSGRTVTINVDSGGSIRIQDAR